MYVPIINVFFQVVVWGYDQQTVMVLQRMQQESEAADTSDPELPSSGQDSTYKVCGTHSVHYIAVHSTFSEAGHMV